MPDLRETKKFWRSRLPHWEIEQGIYFVTIRSTNSLPSHARARLEELKVSVESQDAHSESFKLFQREVFATCEKYLDSGYGFCPFENGDAARRFIEVLESWSEESNWLVPNYCVMPNHVHLIASPKGVQSMNLHKFLSRLKGRSAKFINAILNRTGAFWQTEWFDRWIRNEAELEKTVRYIRNNPVKAGLVKNPEEYPFSKYTLQHRNS